MNKQRSQLDVELEFLKADIIELWRLTKKQLERGKQALINLDKDLARHVLSTEKRVNAYELKIDRDCENIFALFNPVAVDLRFVLAVLKINSNLERIGDIADGVSRFVLDVDNPFSKDLLEKTSVVRMFDYSISILSDTAVAFEKEDTQLARTIFQKDELLDNINDTASHSIIEFIKSNPDQLRESLHVLSIIRKLERVGDQSKNIAEEIIFYLEAKVVKHLSPKEKQER